MFDAARDHPPFQPFRNTVYSSRELMAGYASRDPHGILQSIDFRSFHYYVVNGRTAPINPQAGSFVGQELDLVATYAFKTYGSIQAGYGHFFVGDYVNYSLSAPGRGATDANFVYAQATLNF